jgi:polyisoprenoid-binding protein YceI
MATKWNLDPSHSEVQFKVKHMVISTVSGELQIFDAAIEAENDDFSHAKINFSADVNSINTKNKDRDNHLKAMISLLLINIRKLNLPALLV